MPGKVTAITLAPTLRPVNPFGEGADFLDLGMFGITFPSEPGHTWYTSKKLPADGEPIGPQCDLTAPRVGNVRLAAPLIAPRVGNSSPLVGKQSRGSPGAH